MANRFILNETSYHGAGAIKEVVTEIKARGLKKGLVVTDKDLIKFGVATKVTDLLDEAGLPYEIYDEVKANPTVEQVKNGVQAAKNAGADYLIAIGGGSPQDTCKGIGIILANPEFEDVISLEGVAPTKNKSVPVIAIATTAGTAAETTINYVITDTEKKRKFVCVDAHDIPVVAIIDPEMMSSMPKGLTASTGLDALTHAIEGYTTLAAWELADTLNLKAIEIISRSLRAACANDPKGREDMALGQYMTGMAFSNALLGIVHSMAHKTGAAFVDQGGHIIHGAANAMYLPKVIAYNAKDETAKKRYGVIADYMHLGGENDDEKVALLIKYLRGMNDALNIPHSINHYGADGLPAEVGFVPEDVFLERLPEIAKNAIADACTGSNPRIPTQEEMENLLKACYYDTEVDF